MGGPKVGTRIEKGVIIVAICIILNNVQHMVRNVSNVRKRILPPSFAGVVAVPKITGNPKCFSRKYVH